jgi:D-alanyl-D-alanine carboxypeptidase/D-alanyl-D-alanine-endopeptidase (penicillin-binding protein 4)
VNDPALLAGARLQRALARHGVKLDGRVRVLHWPQSDAALLDHAQALGEVLSPPLIEVLASGLKRSQNLYLQNLLQIAGVRAQASASGDPPTTFLGSEGWGLRALRQLLDRIGIAPSAALLEEGTGLSRQDLTTPAALVRLLQYLAAQPYAAQLRDALPVAGVDGTLQWRMRNTAAAGNVHAKTGSMTYVDCLAGYVTTAAGERLAFAVMLNNYRRPEDAPPAGRDLDAIVESLAELRDPH